MEAPGVALDHPRQLDTLDAFQGHQRIAHVPTLGQNGRIRQLTDNPIPVRASAGSVIATFQ
jgi:hypothetical protein